MSSDDCRCGTVRAGNQEFGKNWSDACPEHGVGTEFFRALPSMPYGYADERDTTREDWLEFLAGNGEDLDIEEPL